MSKKVEALAKVGVGVGVLWGALTKDLSCVLPKAAPNLVRDAEVLEGDGGLGTVILFHFGPDVPHMSCQKEKIVELDDTQLRVAIGVVEGGHLDHGFTSYATSLKLTGIGECETLIDVEVAYESEMEEDATLPEKTANSALAFIKCLENYLQKVV